MATVTLKNGAGADFDAELPLAPGRAVAAASTPTVLATEDKAVLDSLDTKLTTLAGHVDGLETLVTSTNTKLDTAITALQIIDNMSLAAGTADIGKVKVTNNAGTVIDPIASVAHDAVDAGEPNKIGHRAKAGLSAITLTASEDRSDTFGGIDGVMFVRPHSPLEDIVSGNATNTDGASTQCIAAQAAGIKTYLTSVVICNTSASNITVDIKDGTTVKVSLPVPATSGCIFNPPVPVPGTAATAWNFDPSAAATTVTCSMIGFKSKV